MKKIYFYLVALFIILMSCNSSGAKKTFKNDTVVSSDTIEIIKQEQSFLNKRVFVSDPIKRDTTINHYHISYIIQDNDDIITTYPIVYGKGLDTAYYAGREVILDIKYPNDSILHKKIDREFFNSYISKEEIDKYSICYFQFDSITNNESIFFYVNLCVPDTDNCYRFELSFSNKSDIEIKDITSDLDSDEELFLNKRVFVSDPIKRDTTINHYHISYIIQDNDDIFTTYPIVYGKGLDTAYYAGREVILDIKYPNDSILHKKINGEFFNSFLSKEEITKYSICYFQFDSITNNESIFFNVNLCVPDTDVCYWFELSFSNKGDIEIKDITSDLDSEEDM